MTTVVTGAGLIGTAFAQNAIARGEKVVFVDPEPRADFLRGKLGDKGYALARYDVRDLPNLIATIREHKADTVVHTAGLIGNRVQQSLSAGFDINLGGTRNVAEAVRLDWRAGGLSTSQPSASTTAAARPATRRWRKISCAAARAPTARSRRRRS